MVSLIGFVLATRAPVRLLEDIIPVPLDSTAFLGLKFKNETKKVFLGILLEHHFLFV
jgi:hypothetical protein